MCYMPTDSRTELPGYIGNILDTLAKECGSMGVGRLVAEVSDGRVLRVSYKTDEEHEAVKIGGYYHEAVIIP